MTGYGRASQTFSGQKIEIELKSLNSKGLDLRLKVPPAYQNRELEFKRLLGPAVMHGKMDLSLYIESANQAEYQLDEALFAQYLQQFQHLAQKHQLELGDVFANISRLPGVIINKSVEVSETEWAEVQTVLALALEDFLAFRAKEGQVLGQDLALQIQTIQTLLQAVEPHEAPRQQLVRERIRQQLESSEWKNQLDVNRLEQEMIYYLEKFDISEEKIRLRQHCSYFLEVLNEEALQKGHKLGFIAQEIGREVNTLGSKANSAPIQRLVVEMKEALDKIKEQVANVV